MNKLDKLLVDYLNGSDDAFTIIYEETKKGVYLSIYNVVKNKMAIDDLMQDTYIKIIDNLDSYKIGTNFKAWCSRIARNNAINYYNKHRKEELHDDVDILNETNHSLDEALSLLDGLEKDIFIYRIILNYRFKDIATILNIDLKQSFYLYKKSIDKIKRSL